MLSPVVPARLCPFCRGKLSWDLLVLLPMLLYLAVIMPFRLTFANEPIYGTAVYWFEFTIDMVRMQKEIGADSASLQLLGASPSLYFIFV